MNLNYVGSVAERFMKFRSRLAETEGVAEDLFNAISIYVPKSLAQAQLSAEAYDPTTVTAENYAVIAVTVDNYKDVLADGSVLLSQWLPVFNDSTNFAVKLYIIVFDDTGFTPVLTAGNFMCNSIAIIVIPCYLFYIITSRKFVALTQNPPSCSKLPLFFSW